MRVADIVGQIWKSHHKALVALAVLLVFNLFLFVVVGQWLVPQVIEKETLYLQKQTEMRSLLHSQGGSTKSPEQLYILASQDLSKFSQSVPDYIEFTGLIEELLVLSNRANLNIAQISYSSEELEESSLLKFGLSFNVAGKYEQVKKFIHSLEQSTRLLAIKQVSLQSTDEKGVNLLLKLETYFRPGGQES